MLVVFTFLLPASFPGFLLLKQFVGCRSCQNLGANFPAISKPTATVAEKSIFAQAA